jgi:hypothetical protein
MAGGLLQLVASGTQDAPLTNNPEITFFKLVYKKYTNFAIQQNVKNLGKMKFGSFNDYKIDKTGDLLLSSHFIINIPKFDIIRKVKEVINNSIYNVNSLEIIYNKVVTYVYNINNKIYLIPAYMFKIFNYDKNIELVDSNIILNNLQLKLDIVNNYNLIDIAENKINPIISLLRKYNNLIEDLWLYIIINGGYDFNNNLIIQSNYTNYINYKINQYFYINYNYFNNNRGPKEYYELNEIEQYQKYQTITDIIFIDQNNYDVDVVYNYCLINNLEYKIYQTNAILYNSLFIYNVLLQTYPKVLNTFTFWKKYNLLENNVVNIGYINNTFNTFGEWTKNLNTTFDSHLLNSKLQLFEIYKKKYSLVQNSIIQNFNLLEISNPTNLFIILSTFINQYDLTTNQINFDDYNSITNTNLLDQKINEQLNNYSNLSIKNADIYALPNIIKYLTIYPVDLMVIYPYLSYKLVDKLISNLYFKDNTFLILWRNKINNYYFLNYRQFDNANLNNSELYDLTELNRKLTFYSNFDLYNVLFLENIKKYFMDLFYSSSLCCCVNFTDDEFAAFKSTLNIIKFTPLNMNNLPLSLPETNINTYSKLKLINNYNITEYQQNGYQIIISKWLNNTKNTIFSISYNNIIYYPKNFVFSAFQLILNFEYIIKLNNFILIELQEIDIPLVLFDPMTSYNINQFYTFNIFTSKQIDNIESGTNIFSINNLIINLPKTVDTYFNYFKIIKIVDTTGLQRFLLDEISSYEGKYQIISNNQNGSTFNKNNLLSVDIEYFELIYIDLGTIDSNSIIDNKFTISDRNKWVYNSSKTYWLVYKTTYISLKFTNNYFYVLDPRDPVIYTIREIDNASYPSFYNFINHYENTTKPSDLMDFFIQTPMLILSKSLDYPQNTTNYSNYFTKPYLYLYNIPYIINNETTIYLNNVKIVRLLPLNNNEFFNRQINTLFDKEILQNGSTRFELLNEMSNMFDLTFNDPQYINIINTLEKSKNQLINLNISILNDITLYGNTTKQIIKNSGTQLLNTYDLFTYNNDEFEKYNKFALDIYGNNTLISNNIIQGLTNYIYNIPIVSYLKNRKISTNLINYLLDIPIFFQEQINYINNNIDYLELSNKNLYLENFLSITQIKLNIEQTTYDYDDNINIKLLFPLDDSNFSSIYFNNNKLLINQYNNNYDLTLSTISSNLTDLINYDDMFNVDILDTYQEKFKYYGPIYLDELNNINFNTNIDISNYNYIQLDNNKIYQINQDILDVNFINYNGYLYNITVFKDTIEFINLNKNVYYYKITFDISNNYILSGNIIYNKLYYYYEVIDFYTIQIISDTKFDYYIQDYFISYKKIDNINDLFNTINFDSINLITLNNIKVLEYNIFNNYNKDSKLSCNFIIDQIINPIVKRINNYNFVYKSNDNKINLITYNCKKLPPFKINNNYEFLTYNEYISLEIIKLDNYIFKKEDLVTRNILQPNNYELSYLNLTQLNLINYEISGTVTIVDNIITIIFVPVDASTLFHISSGLVPYSYYLINNSFIYIKEITDTIIIIDDNVNYYNAGTFTNISLLDNNYFDEIYPCIIDYQQINLSEDLLNSKLTGVIPIINNYDIDALNYSYNKILNYDISSINILGNDEMKIDILLGNFIRPIIIKNNVSQNSVPICNFVYSYNNQIINDSFIVLKNKPEVTAAFVTLKINFTKINKIVALEPCFSIFSNNNFTSNIISFNDNTGILNNKIYLWKLLINDIYPVYFWTVISQNYLNYSSDQICEPIYISSIHTHLFNLNPNVQFSGSLPNILQSQNDGTLHVLQINNNIYYTIKLRTLATRYYLNILYKNAGKQDILKYNFHNSKKNEPVLKLLIIKNIKFSENFIYLDKTNIDILKRTNYLLIQNGSNYFYCNIIYFNDNGIIVKGAVLNNNFDINIYYTYENIIFNKNKLLLSNTINGEFEIINYEFNNLFMNEIIIINDNIFIVQGLNTWTNHYDILPIQMNNPEIYNNFNINGYFSLGIIHKKDQLKKPITRFMENMVYYLDNNKLNIGDYFISNNKILIKKDNTLISDIFAYNNQGYKISINVINNNFYYLGELDFINNNDILIYNSQTYKIKTVCNRQIYFYNYPVLSPSTYIFYYPYQPFNITTLIINNQPLNDDSSKQVCNILQPLINDFSFIEIENTFYQVKNNQFIMDQPYNGTDQHYNGTDQHYNGADQHYNGADQHYNRSYLVRIAEFQNNNYFFENELVVDSFINTIVNDEITIKLKGIKKDSNTIDLNSDKILFFHFYYLQPIKINSTINFILNTAYRGTTTFITVANILDFDIPMEIIFTPNIINTNNYYSLFNVKNFTIPNLNNYTATDNIISYTVLNDKLQTVEYVYNSNSTISFYNNYIPINTQIQHQVGSYHLILEINTKNENIVHLVKIVYPRNLYFYSNITDINSKFYLDKIYPIVFNTYNFGFTILDTVYFNKKKLLDTNANFISIWYKYPITVVGLPTYENKLFKLQILNGSEFLNKQVYLTENALNAYIINIINDKFYLVSDTYLGNNISFLYLKTINYIKYSYHNFKKWKNNYQCHNDSTLNKYLDANKQNWIEKIANPVVVKLDTIGAYYKYKIFSQNNISFILNTIYNFTIGDPSLLIKENNIYNGNSFIYTENIIPNISGKTTLYSINQNNIDYFDQINLSKTVPELISKIKHTTDIFKPYMIYNIIKPWSSWSILSNYNSCKYLLNNGDIMYKNNVIIQNPLSEIYFTNDELKYLSELLIFINSDRKELDKIYQQEKILNILLNQLQYWILDTSFWLNVTARINIFLRDYGFININFTGDYLIFNDEIDTVHFILVNGKIKRKYVLNNQYILINGNQISRDINKIYDELNLLSIGGTSYGIELNDLLYYLKQLGDNYLELLNNMYNTNKVFSYFNSIKLFINTLWNKYENTFKMLNNNFNEKLKLVYNYQLTKKEYYKMNSNYEFIKVSIDNISISDEFYIYNQSYYLDSNEIYPYYVYLSKNIIVPDIVYNIKFINHPTQNITLLNQSYNTTFPNEIEFYLYNDINSKIDYYITGINNYNSTSIFLGNLYSINLNNQDIDFKLINLFCYKNIDISLYSHKMDNILFSSKIELQINNYIELINIVGIIEQYNEFSNNYIKFYQNNFNYIINNTYIKTDNLFLPLHLDLSGNYYINDNITLPDSINIVVLFLIENIYKTDNLIYKIYLDKPFKNFNDYIRNSLNIIPTNFKLNDLYIPNDIILDTDIDFIVNISFELDIIKLTHYANLGEIPPLQIKSLIKQNVFLYNTYEILSDFNNLKSINNIIVVRRPSFEIDLSCNINYLSDQVERTYLQFTLNQNFANEELNNIKLLLINYWNISVYVFNPINYYLQFDYPIDFKYKALNTFDYTINNYIIDKKTITITNNKISMYINTSISGPIIFNQIYKSQSIVYKPSNNQSSLITFIANADYDLIKNIYLIPLDQNGNELGYYLYKIILSKPLHFKNDLLTVLLYNNYSNYKINIFYSLDNYNIIISTNEQISINSNYKILYINNIINVVSINFYQNSYIPGNLYYQDNLNYINIFIPENINSFDFTNQECTNRYYFVGINTVLEFKNIFNERNFETSSNMKIKQNIITNVYTTIEKPIFVSPIKWLKFISLYLGEQLVEKLNEDTFNIYYYYYCTEEKRMQLDKLFKIVETKDNWQVFIPLLFWFYNNSTLALPFVALPYMDFFIKYQIDNLGNLLSNDITNVEYSIEPSLKLEICLDSIILDIPERNLFGSFQHEYIIERFNIYPDNLVYLKNQVIPINFKNLVKDIFWITQPIYNLDTTSYSNIKYKRDILYEEYLKLRNKYELYLNNSIGNYINNFFILEKIDNEVLINKSNRINIIKNSKILILYDLKYILYFVETKLLGVLDNNILQGLLLYFVNNYENKKIITEINPIESFNLQSNGTNLFYKFDSSYYNNVIAYQKFFNSAPIGYYSYSFSLFPNDKQPSGHTNFNHIENMVINLTNNSNVFNEPYNLKTIVKEYQILRIMSGLGSLA